ncbi:MAG: DDE-type integrase/transposase/recombinase, partial [Sphaerochaetaceae bacterium]|nr:DDE-type integrase/transposase/recombinase [Sphaerochaetaceae bacterium]
YQEKIKPKKNEPDTNISKAKKNFTSKYLLASEEQQEKAILKIRLCELYYKKDISLNQSRFLEKIIKEDMDFFPLGNISIKQLNDWLRKYNEAKAKGLNVVEEFIDTRGRNRKKSTALNKEQQEMAQRYFIRNTHVVITNIYLLMCKAFGNTMPSYDALNRFYKLWQKENPQLAIFSKSPDKWKNKCQMAVGDESEKAKYRNHYWEFDATPADILCNDGKRYTILGLIDVYTRRPIFTVEESNSSFSVSRLLREGILRLGIPENVVLDNGKEFVSNHFRAICNNLDINPLVMPPFSGEKKPFIERMFRILSSNLFASMQEFGFIGHSVAMRADIQAKQSFEHKIMAQKKHNKKLKSVDEEDLEKQKEKAFINKFLKKKENIGIEIKCALSKKELQRRIDEWVEKIYEQRVHGTLEKKPIEVWNAHKTPVNSIADARMLDLLLGESFERVVRKKGIGLQGAYYAAPELAVHVGKSVKVMTTSDLGEIVVYDASNMNLICRAFDYTLLGIQRELAIKTKKKSLKVRAKLQKTIKEAEAVNDPTILDVLDDTVAEIKANTYATTKKTAITSMLLNESSLLEEQDKKVLENSKKHDFKVKDEKGLPKKVHETNRKEFVSFEDKILFILKDKEDPKRDEKLKKFKRLKPDSYKRAVKKFEKEKTA